MGKLRITYTKSKIHCPKPQKLTLEALGLKKLNSFVEVEKTPQIIGMANKVKHLIKIEEI
jgi:large subunit ribosomal protein L30